MRDESKRRRGGKKSTSLLSKVMVPMILLALLQVCVFGVLLLLNGGFSYVKRYSYSLLSEKTGNRKTYVESVFNQKTPLVYETANEVVRITERILAERSETAADLKKDRELARRILEECAESLISLLRRDMVNDAFLILDTGTLYDDGAARLRPGLYLRDTDVEENSVSDNKDIFLELGSSETARSFGLTLDFEWALHLDVTREESGNYDFFFTTLSSGEEAAQGQLYQLGYWSGLSRISASQQESIKYTLPLIARDGTVCGVLGIGLLTKTIEQSIPATDFFGGSTCYVLGADLNGDGEYEPLLYHGSAYNRLMTEKTVLSEREREAYGLYDFTAEGRLKVIGCIEYLNLYASGSPYRDQRWALISVADKAMILENYYALFRIVLISMLIVVAVSIAVAVGTSRRLTMPVTRIVGKIRGNRDNYELMQFNSSGISEIDALAASVVELQADIIQYASRVSRIMTMSGSRIGVFLYDCSSGNVFVGESLIKLLSFDGLPDRDVTICAKEFKKRLEKIDREQVILSLPIFDKNNPEGKDRNDSREIEYTEENGAVSWFKFVLTRDKTNVMGFVQDITSTVREKHEIAREKDDEYTQRLIEANQALRAAYASAEQASNAKTDFLSRMSHDIRTPLNAIIGMTMIAENAVDDREKLRDCFQKISASSSYLLALVNEVLDMSKIESGKFVLSKEKINLSELADNLVEMALPSVKAKQHELTVQMEKIEHKNVIGDGLRIQQVFMNLMSNAVKYTPPGGHICFRMEERTAGQDDVGCYEFVFRDNGKGMSPEFLERVFQPFEREEDERVNKEQGTGLGMAITYNIVRLMDGSIRVESEVNRGTTFTVTLYLPFADGETTRPEEPLGGEQQDALTTMKKEDFSGCRALLVDDNELNREIAKEILGMVNLAVEMAENGQEAVDKFSASAPGYYDIIFMDVQMPVMNGYDASRAIRALPREDAQEIPIVAMTANAFVEDVRDAKNAGMNEHIPKPLDLKKLFATLKRWVKKRT